MAPRFSEAGGPSSRSIAKVGEPQAAGDIQEAPLNRVIAVPGWVGLPDADQLNLLVHDTVAMTILAQDVSVTADGRPVTAALAVPAERLQPGPRGHRFHVVDVAAGTSTAQAPVRLTDPGDAWTYRDHWRSPAPDPSAQRGQSAPADLAADRDFRAQNVFAVAAHTLHVFERCLGRPIPWHSGYPHLFLVPQARLEANAFYSREHNAVLFGWLPAVGELPALYTALSYDVIAHEVSHAILDGLRPHYTDPGLPDQLAFHEALADLVAMLSVFGIAGVAETLLAPSGTGGYLSRVSLSADPAKRAEELLRTPLTRLAEQIGRRRKLSALRASGELRPFTSWATDPVYAEPHRRAEILVAAFLHTLAAMWSERIGVFRRVRGAMDTERVAEEGTTAAEHLLGMLLRSLDYLPPVELEFADVVDSILTADQRVAPDDKHHYRDALAREFARWGIVPPSHSMLDEDGNRTSNAGDGTATEPGPYEPDPDASPPVVPGTGPRIRYEHLNLVSLRSSPEAVYGFIWNNAGLLEIDVRLDTVVERVISSTRVGPDGLVVHESVADYVQRVRVTGGTLPAGMRQPAGLGGDEPVTLLGGGVLVFDQFGRFRLHQRKPVLDVERQNRRLDYLVTNRIRGRDGYGSSDGAGDVRRFQLLHTDEEW